MAPYISRKPDILSPNWDGFPKVDHSQLMRLLRDEALLCGKFIFDLVLWRRWCAFSSQCRMWGKAVADVGAASGT